eukprot:scaffold26706_cov78-Skeletonema_dohrnii-CCMP3373.AAC.1
MTSTTNYKVNASTAKNCVNIPTKTYDGGAKATNDSEPSAKKSRQPVPILKHQDPFLYYSHQETRMNELLLNDDNVDGEQVIRVSDMRKTRISFEVHPSLVIESLFLQDHHRLR